MQDMEGDILEKGKPSAPVKDSEGRRIDEDAEPYAAGLVPFGGTRGGSKVPDWRRPV